MLRINNIDLISFTNMKMLKKRPSGILVELHSLGDESSLIDLVRKGRKWANYGVLYIYPYTSPWNWMNSDSVRLLDEILDVIFVSEQELMKLPVVVLGYSMGGHGALVYPAFSKHSINTCLAVCPICDLIYHFTENAYVARTLITAYFCESDLNKALTDQSPLFITNIMPKIPYLIVHCRNDERVSIVNHSDKLAQKMKNDNFNIMYHIVENGGHCKLDEYSKSMIDDFLLRHLS